MVELPLREDLAGDSATQGLFKAAIGKIHDVLSNMYQKEEIDNFVVTALNKITGTLTTTNETNNINMVGVGSLDSLNIGDVITISGSTSNDGEFTVEVITDTDNIIVNQAHAGGTTSKSLIDESATSSVTIKLLSKWFDAPLGLGQGKVDVTSSRALVVTYPNDTNRTIKVSSQLRGDTDVGVQVQIDGSRVLDNQVDSTGSTTGSVMFTVFRGEDYLVDDTFTSDLIKWEEWR